MSDHPNVPDPQSPASSPRRQDRRVINWQTASAFAVFLAIVAAVAIAIGIYVHGLVGH